MAGARVVVGVTGAAVVAPAAVVVPVLGGPELGAAVRQAVLAFPS